ncbi:MAG: hypothetical protein KIS76_05305 [Pyrinomonadaceae bacterium]|nr:hypothetical protein [Pyrinomonadaceae bacterium]
MLIRQKFFTVCFLLLVVSALAAVPTHANGNEYDAVCDRLESKFQAKKVKIPFMWLARMAVGIVRPAGVKSFKVTTYTDLKFSREDLDNDMRVVMRDAFSADWSPILRIRSKTGDQVYMNMRESGKNVKVLIVTINEKQATVIRAKFNPEKLGDFIDNPEIFGISLGENEETAGKNAKRKEKLGNEEMKGENQVYSQ